MPNPANFQKAWSYYQTEAPDTFRGSAFRLHYLTRYLKNGQKVLNVGIGGGLFEQFCRQIGVHVFSIDPDWRSLHKHQDKNEYRLTAGQIEDLPFSDNVFDVVVVSEVLEHLTQELTQRALREIRRVLIPHGQVLGTVPSRENLADGAVICPRCGEVFHKVGHLQSFSTTTMTSLLQTVFSQAECYERAFMAKATVGRKESLIGHIRNALVLAGLLTREKHIVFRAQKASFRGIHRHPVAKCCTGGNARLALFVPSLAGGGAEKRMLNLAAEFVKEGHEVDMLLVRAEGAYLNRMPANVHVVELGASRPLKAIPALVRYLSAKKPDALLATLTNANMAAIWATQLARVKTRCVVSEASHLSKELQHSPAHNRFLIPLLMRFFFPTAHAIVAVSNEVADDLSNVTGMPRQAIRVIYNPVVSSDLRVKSKEPVSHPWLVSGGTPVIVGMGRLTRQKNFETLIRAFAEVRRQIPSKLIILGEGEDRPMLERLAMDLDITGDLDFPGFIANPYPFLANASLFVLSSRWEGLPWALVEALACGTKVVSTDCPSGPREILARGEFGQLCPVEDVPAMAASMMRALTGKFVAADPSRWLERFSLETNSKSYLEILLQ
jgi:glycosyltransferase involved in cell wall biosynthesis/ubiquinone/menaquinone biosynthesis C-methylase UbiE